MSHGASSKAAAAGVNLLTTSRDDPSRTEVVARGGRAFNSLYVAGALWQVHPMQTDGYRIRMITPDEVDRFVAHHGAHDEESGTNGDLPNGPYSRTAKRDPADVRARALLRWDTPLDEPGWRRDWGLYLGESIVGSVHLGGGELEASLHRADLGIGIERPHRAKGQGFRLMTEAIAWARTQPTLDWIDLGVFEGNRRAIGLYERLGFVVCGKKADLFRVDGLSITDIQMTLPVH